LGLSRLNTTIWWQGRSGLILDKMRQQINIMLRYENPPDLIIIHIAGNDIGNVRLGYLQFLLKNIFLWLWDKCPGSLVVWSQILPRLNWRFSTNTQAMDRARRRLNSTIAKFVLSRGGCYIHYPDLKADGKLLIEDGVHLTLLGNEVFLNIVQGAIVTFLFDTNGP